LFVKYNTENYTFYIGYYQKTYHKGSSCWG
jgi:hypothetical protein